MPVGLIIKKQANNLTTAWGRAVISLLVIIPLILLIFYDTVGSIVSVWSGSETFMHGFFIIPISSWLVWNKRKQLFSLSPASAFLPLGFVFLAGFGWSLAHLADVIVIQQLALVFILIASIWTVLGNQITRLLMFPLMFLFFGVPMGDELIPPMMHFTADFTVELLRISGIPVYREGLYFSLPSGDWSVVKACSGIRYLLASVTLGTLYAYLSYQSLRRRLIFILASILVPIVANSIRAYIIVMLGHVSDMKLATGVDHLVYGWLFFGLIILLMFGIGSIWREDKDKPTVKLGDQTELLREIQPRFRVFISSLFVVGVVALWPFYTLFLNSASQSEQSDITIRLPGNSAHWIIAEKNVFPWEPGYLGYDKKVSARYQDKDNHSIYLSILLYQIQREGKELINSQNVLIKKKDLVWKGIDNLKRQVDFGQPLKVKESRLRSADRQLLVWRWNWIAGVNTVNDYYGKLLQVKSRFFGENSPSAVIIVAIDSDSDSDRDEGSRVFLEGFLEEMSAKIESSLKNAIDLQAL